MMLVLLKMMKVFFNHSMYRESSS